jgi:hypothetical protein
VEQEHGQHPPPLDRRDLLAKLDKICTRIDNIDGECITEAGQLSQLVIEISNALVDMGMLLV